MKREGAIEKPAAGTSGTEFFQCGFARFDDPGVLGQAQIVVGGNGDDVASLNGDVRAVHRLDFAKVRVDAEGLGLVGGVIIVAFGKDIIALLREGTQVCVLEIKTLLQFGNDPIPAEMRRGFLEIRVIKGQLGILHKPLPSHKVFVIQDLEP